MKSFKLIKLTPQQETIFLGYKNKWSNVATSTKRINRNKAKQAIANTYDFLALGVPEIIFFDSPYTASLGLDDEYVDYIEDYEVLMSDMYFKVNEELPQLSKKICYENFFDLSMREDLINLELSLKIDSMRHLIAEEMGNDYNLDNNFTGGQVQPDSLCALYYKYDFHVSELNQEIYFKAWNIFKEVLMNCGLIAAYPTLCVICDRPTQLFFDEQNSLHAEGKPAVEYADGYKLYAHHGIAIPEKYGKVKYSKWKSEWLSTEEDPSVKKVLLKVLNQ